MQVTLFLRLPPLLLIIAIVAGCSSSGGYFSTKDKAYRSQREAADNLEIPPDLSSGAISDEMTIPGGASTSYSDYSSGQTGSGSGTAKLVRDQVLPEFEGIAVKRDGDQRWLVIDASPSDVWYKVVEFWRKNGLLLVEQDPAIGVMTTDWLESRADIKQGVITEFLRKALDSVYSSATRDRFRVRLEEGETPGTTELYLTHQGMVEELVKDVAGQADTTYWTPRPNEPETEAAMLRSLMLYLGVSEAQTEQSLAKSEPKKARSELIEQGEAVELLIHERFSRAWRLTGVALDRVGFAVEDRNRSEGIYYVRYHPMDGKKKKGFFAKLAFWRDDDIEDQSQYQIRLVEQADDTQVTVSNLEGKRLYNKTAIRLLTLLHEQIR